MPLLKGVVGAPLGVAQLHIRPATVDDVEFLWAMLFYAAHADEQPGATRRSIRSDPDLQRYLDGWGTRPGDDGVVAVDGGQPVGAAWLRLFTADEVGLVTYVAPDVPELAIAVVPGRIGGGVGGTMMARLLADADAAGVPAVVLSARADNPAVRLYERHGFTVTDRIVNRVGTESVKMLRPRPGGAGPVGT